MLAHLCLFTAVWTSMALSLATPLCARAVDIDVGAGVRIHVVDRGPPQSTLTPLVFIPGWRFTNEIWSHQVEAFSRDRRVIAIDPRSQGDSTKTPDGDTPEQRAQDLHVLLQKLGVSKFIIIGWSQGVQDVGAYLNRYGSASLDKIVLVDSTISSGAANLEKPPGFAARQLGLLPMFMVSPRSYTESMMRAVITKSLAPGELNALIDQALKTPTATGAAMLVADMFGVDRSDAIAKIDRPTLIIASPRSFELDAQKAMAARIPNAEFRIVEGAGHAVFIDQPDAFEAMLRAFITTAESPHFMLKRG